MLTVNTLAALAKHHGVSRPAVSGWKRRGLIVFDSTGAVNPIATDEKLRAAAVGLYRPTPAATSSDATEIERRKQTAIARKHELDVADREARLVDADEAHRITFELADRLLRGIRSMPAKYSDAIARRLNRDPQDVADALSVHVQEVVAELAADLRARRDK